MPAEFLLYGSYGYTGRLVAERALERGLRPVLAGRDPDALRRQAEETGLPHRVADLDDPAALDAALAGVPVVLHAAGPFSRTARPMVDACLRTGTHYLDINGELQVMEALAARGEEARRAGVMLLPGVGWDVVPTDSLAAHLKRRLPSATRLALAFRWVGGGVSRGTARVGVEGLGRGGVVRRGGRLTPVPPGEGRRRVDFGRGPVEVSLVPWADVSTAYHSTGIPDVEVYTRLPAATRRMVAASRYLGWLLRSAPVQRLLKAAVGRQPPGPTERERAESLSLVWGEVEDDRGGRATALLRTPGGYTHTAHTAVGAVEEVLGGRAEPGFRTPSQLFGPDWVLGFEGVERRELD